MLRYLLFIALAAMTSATAVAQAISSFPYTESFEAGLGAWTQSAGDDMDWTLKSGTTTSSGTGPNGAADGTFYVYTEASSPNYPSKAAELTASFNFAGLANPALAFQYHMYGATMGTLNVDVFDGTTWQNAVWSQSGQIQTSNGEAWRAAQVDLSSYAGMPNVTIRFRGVTGSSFQSDMCIDNLYVGDPNSSSVSVVNLSPTGGSNLPESTGYVDATFSDTIINMTAGNVTVYGSASTSVTVGTPVDLGGNVWRFPLSGLEEAGQLSLLLYGNLQDGLGNDLPPISWSYFVIPVADVSSFPYAESFEAGMGAWSQSTGDDIDWTRKSGTTASSGTGPNGAADGTFYVYTEASSPNFPSKTAELTASFNFTGLANPHLTFQYHMYGATMGTLNVDVFDGTTWQNAVWSQSGQVQTTNGDSWGTAQVNLSAYGGADFIGIRFRGVTGTSYTSDMSIDNILVFNQDPLPKAVFYQQTFNDLGLAWGSEDYPWQFGEPLGQGGSVQGNPDPVSGATGDLAWGVDLGGDYYESPGPPGYLISDPIDCRNQSGVELHFQRWLNVDVGVNVAATVSVSNDGVNWTEVFRNPAGARIEDAAWTEVAYDVSAVADGFPTVFVRWGHEVLDGSAVPMSGWNVDDVKMYADGNVRPLAVSDDFAAPSFEPGTVVGNVLLNDSDPNEGDVLQLSQDSPVSTVQHGTLNYLNSNAIP